MLPTFVLYTLMCLKYIGKPFTNFTVKNLTVDETGHFTWAMFGEDDSSIMSTNMFKTLTEC